MATINVSTVANAVLEYNSAAPGDVVALADGTYPDALFELNSNGTSGNEVILKPQNPGQVILTQESAIYNGGTFGVVDGFRFEGGYTGLSGGGAHVRFETSGGVAATDCRLTGVSFVDYVATNYDDNIVYARLFGERNRIDHCYFSGKEGDGQLIEVKRPDSTLCDHLIDYNYFGPRAATVSGNLGEAVKLGGESGRFLVASGIIVEYNYFYMCEGEGELVSCKTSDIILRYNLVKKCRSRFSFRQGSRNKGYGNRFFGDGRTEGGGFSISGADHELSYNYYQDLNTSEHNTFGGIVIKNGTAGSSYIPVTNLKIDHETLVNCGYSLSFSTNYGSYSTKPSGVVIANTTIQTTVGQAIKEFVSQTGITYQNCKFQGTTLGITKPAGITVVDPGLTLATDGLYRPATSGPLDGTAGTALTSITVDIDGQTVGSPADIGCDYISGASVTVNMLTRCDVGPTDYDPDASGCLALAVPTAPTTLALNTASLAAGAALQATWDASITAEEVTSITLVLTDPTLTETEIVVGNVVSYDIDTSAFASGSWTVEAYSTNVTGNSARSTSAGFTILAVPILASPSTPTEDIGNVTSSQVAWDWTDATGSPTSYPVYLHGANPLIDPTFAAGLQASSSDGWRVNVPSATDINWTLSSGSASRTASSTHTKLYTNYGAQYDDICVRFLFHCTAGSLTVGTGFNEYEVTTTPLTVSDDGTTIERTVHPIHSAVSTQTLLVLNASADFVGSVESVYMAPLNLQTPDASTSDWTYTTTGSKTHRISYKAKNAAGETGFSTSGSSTSLTEAPPAVYAPDLAGSTASTVPKVFSPLASYTYDGDVGTVTVSAKTDGTNGTVAITDSNTTVTYTPTGAWAGEDIFTYTLSGDGAGGPYTSIGTVTITTAAAITYTLSITPPADVVDQPVGKLFTKTILAEQSGDLPIEWSVSCAEMAYCELIVPTGDPADKTAVFNGKLTDAEYATSGLGPFNVTVTVDDGENTPVSDVFTVTFIVAPEQMTAVTTTHSNAISPGILTSVTDLRVAFGLDTDWGTNPAFSYEVISPVGADITFGDDYNDSCIWAHNSTDDFTSVAVIRAYFGEQYIDLTLTDYMVGNFRGGPSSGVGTAIGRIFGKGFLR